MKSRRPLRFVLFITLMALAASLFLNFLLFNRARQYYVQLNGTRLDPLGVIYRDESWAAPLPPAPDALTVVFYGDSRAAEWPAPAVPGARIVNRAVHGQTTEQVRLRYGRHVAPLQPDVVLLQVGINDLKTIPLFPYLEEEIIARCQENIAAIVAEATAQGAIVILTTIFPVGTPPLERRVFWSDDITTAVSTVNRQLATLAADNVLLFDAHTPLLAANGRLHPDFSLDELHLNAAGYAALDAGLLPTLTALAAK
ncbi:MAG: SGNH/GDSL hydrolase family protein [Anaerolineales bacterium]|nr:SGNH/GDSL hydrolase family protein [Anaerolineales bacterium]